MPAKPSRSRKIERSLLTSIKSVACCIPVESAFLYKVYNWPWFNSPYYSLFTAFSTPLYNPFKPASAEKVL